MATGVLTRADWKDRHPMVNGCCCSGCREMGKDIISFVFRTRPVSDSQSLSARKFLISYDVLVVALRLDFFSLVQASDAAAVGIFANWSFWLVLNSYYITLNIILLS
jgi:hypothetical protein